jgi:hypothetical protein
MLKERGRYIMHIVLIAGVFCGPGQEFVWQYSKKADVMYTGQY